MEERLAFYAALPAKRMGAGMVLTDPAGRVLLVEPAYKEHWEIPGGIVEAGESPRAAAEREVAEELGLVRPAGSLLVLDWGAAQEHKTESVMLLFDGGVVADEEAAAIEIPAEELRSFAFCTPEEADVRLGPRLGARLRAALDARERGVTAYLESGASAPRAGGAPRTGR
jgi:ADP-ribose pyrophosphatase YjhB (NUDIX family)